MFVSPFLDWQSVFSKLVQTSTHQTSRYPSLAMWGTETSTYFLIDPANEAEDLKQFQQLNDRLIERALKMGGTCTGEHGVGIGKIHYMRAEHGESVEMMRQIKQALDPLNLFNPG